MTNTNLITIPIKPRRIRRLEAHKHGVPFVPQYNGFKPKTHKEMYGVGYERFGEEFAKEDE